MNLRARLEYQKRSAEFSVNNLVKLVKRPKKTPLNYEKVIERASDNKVIGEMGGYWKLNGNSLDLYESGKGLITRVDGISRYAFKHNSIPGDAYPWHSHPYSQGWWPSTENLVSVRSSEYRPHIIFTKWGVWVFRKSRNNNLKLGTVYNTLFNDFNKDILSKTNVLYKVKSQKEFNDIFNWTLKGIMEHWKERFENFGIHITFFRTYEKDRLLNYLKRDIEER